MTKDNSMTPSSGTMWIIERSVVRTSGFIVCALLLCLVHQHNAYIPFTGSGVQKLRNESLQSGLSVQWMQEDPMDTKFPIHNNRWGIQCYNQSEDTQTECTCIGLNMVRVPQDMPTEIERLHMKTVGIVTLRTNALRNYPKITDLILSDLPKFKSIESHAFEHLQHLRTIYISNAPVLQTLSVDTFKGMSDSLKSLRIVNSGLVQVPNLIHLHKDQILTMVDLEGNRISRIPKKSITLKTEQLILANNDLTSVGDMAFHGSSIAKLSLKGNTKLVDIHKGAFKEMVFIRELDLSETNVVAIPTEGLDKLEVLRIQNTQSLKIIPSVFHFKNLQEAWLTHHFHCCAFIFPARHDPESFARLQKDLKRYQEQCDSEKVSKRTRRRSAAATSPTPSSLSRTTPSQTTDAAVSNRDTELSRESAFDGFSGAFLSSSEEDDTTSSRYSPLAEDEDDGDLGSFSDGSFEGQFSMGPEDGGHFHNTSFVIPWMHTQRCGNLTLKTQQIKCYPQPDALNPCEDVMGSDWLRFSVWFVVSFTVFGNVAVLIVILSSRSGVSVFKFLVSNLAFADLCTGLYLLLVASMDIHSIGEYFNFAFDWQYGVGCQTAGFLTVFASNLSVYTLTVITIERWLTITYAIYLKKRIKLRTAVFIMLGGWLYSIGIALMPLFGFSNYSSTSICLPMESRDWNDRSFLLALLLTSALAFVIIAISYAKIYFSLGRQTRQAEVTVAKKMILLVFTNFVCFAPILFFALTAMAGYPLIDVAKSKILLVFFYPLNSCANPYLYAIITTQYRKDLFTLLSKCGLCAKRAQKYRISYSIPINHTQVPLMSTNTTSTTSAGDKKKAFAKEVIQAQLNPMIELKKLKTPETEM